jgi:hypothetical protein
MKFLNTLGIIFFCFIGVTGGLLHVSETIPDNAKIYIYPSQRTWAPNSYFMDRDFKNQLTNPVMKNKLERMLSEQTEAKYKDVKKGGQYEGFKIFPVLLREKEI